MVFKIDSYEPINELKPVAENIWIVDGRQILFKGIPFTTRMTIVRLSNGDLFVHSPTQLTNGLKAEIDRLGSVRHLVSPNKIHYWWIGEWGNHYANAIKWASPGVRPAAAKQGWQFDIDLTDVADTAWNTELDQAIARGGRFMEEVVFFHRQSRTLILADLIENFEPSKVHSRTLRFLLQLAGNVDPDGKLPIDLRITYWGRHHKLLKLVRRMIAWNPERIILAHGRWYQSNGTAELKRAFRYVRGLGNDKGK